MEDAIRRILLQSIRVAKSNRLKKMEARNLKIKIEKNEEEDLEDVLENKWTIKFSNLYQPWLFYFGYKVNI